VQQEHCVAKDYGALAMFKRSCKDGEKICCFNVLIFLMILPSIEVINQDCLVEFLFVLYLEITCINVILGFSFLPHCYLQCTSYSR